MKNLQIEIIFNENSKRQAINFKKYIEKREIDTLQEVEVNRTETSEGQLGEGDILGSVKLVIEAANKPLTELVRALRDYVKGFRTEITIRSGEKTIKITTSNPQKIESLIKVLLNSSDDNLTGSKA